MVGERCAEFVMVIHLYEFVFHAVVVSELTNKASS